MEPKVVLVTGATDGIGRETALELARRGCALLVHGRDRGRVDATLEAVRAAGAPRAEGVVADLASLRQVRALAADVKAKGERLDVLLHNAGVYMRERRLTEDGHEVTFQVNHLAPFLLTLLLRPALADTARIVTVSSVAHTRGQIAFDDLDGERGFSGYGAYAASKLGNVLFTRELAERLAGTGLSANALHPGVINTKLLKAGFGAVGSPDAAEGARTSVYLATSPEVEGVSGRYFSGCQAASPAPQALDAAVQKRLWEESERLVGERWPG